MPDNNTDAGQRKETSGRTEKVEVPGDIEVQCCGKWRQDWRLSVVKDVRQLS